MLKNAKNANTINWAPTRAVPPLNPSCSSI
jgi:hypothetical protein